VWQRHVRGGPTAIAVQRRSYQQANAQHKTGSGYICSAEKQLTAQPNSYNNQFNVA